MSWRRIVRSLADVSAPALYTDLVARRAPAGAVPASHRPASTTGPRRSRSTGPSARPCRGATRPAGRPGTVHLADSFEELSAAIRQVDSGYIPASPFLLVGQMTTVDATRSPAGTESMWAYTHVPQETRGDAGGDLAGKWDDDEGERFADRIEARIEQYAPGFRDQIVARHIFTPRSLEAANANLVGGDVGGGTQKLRQQLVLRPIPGSRAAPRRRSTASTWRRRRRTRAAVCTVRAARTPPVPRWRMSVYGAIMRRPVG